MLHYIVVGQHIVSSAHLFIKTNIRQALSKHFVYIARVSIVNLTNISSDTPLLPPKNGTIDLCH